MSSSAPQPARRAWTLAGALQPAQVRTPERRARSLSGLPRRPVPGQRWPMRLLTSPWTWITLVLVQLYAFCLWRVYAILSPDKELGQGQVMPGLDADTLKHCAHLAAPTAIVWICAFVLLDRLRPLRPLLWFLAFGWGSCVAIYSSLVVNSWAAEMMNVTASAGDPAAQARPAVFAAPFVEEAAKATILFLLAILVRYRIVSALQGVALAGCSAIGFAFSENIVYYARAIVYGSVTQGTGDVDAAVNQLVLLRGVFTSYGHPLFTMMTGIGLVLGLRTRSKLVRILAPLTGYCVAALGHMFFNGSSSTGGMDERRIYIQFAVVIGGMLAFMARQELKEISRVRTRLEDYVRMGWLDAAEPANYGSFWRRAWLCLVALRHGPRTFLATLQRMRAATELAYLRDAIVRGIVDDSGHEREAELLAEMHRLRPRALSESRGLRMQIPWARLAVWRRRRPANQWPAPTA